MNALTDSYKALEEHIRRDECMKMIEEGYIHKSKCPRAHEDQKLKNLKKANRSLQRKIIELQNEINTNIIMRS